MMNFDKCPRCLKDTWKQDGTRIFRCKLCRMIYNPDNIFNFLRLKIDHNQYIIWSLNFNTCELAIHHINGDGLLSRVESISLPWLPFDITLDQIKMYVVFS